MIQKLNVYLADLSVLFHKLQNFHWYIKGKDFFVVHAKLEEYYDYIKEAIDEIAEHILMIGGQPEATLEAYLKLSNIKEAPAQEITSEIIYQQVIADFEYLLESVVAIKKEADETSDYLTSTLMDDYIKQYTKSLWMLKQTLK
jgi:starvation-inducible DNA-binding protein